MIQCARHDNMRVAFDCDAIGLWCEAPGNTSGGSGTLKSVGAALLVPASACFGQCLCVGRLHCSPHLVRETCGVQLIKACSMCAVMGTGVCGSCARTTYDPDPYYVQPAESVSCACCS